MSVGFTGTRRGLTARQREALPGVLFALWAKHLPVLRHGDCVGADEEAHRIAKGPKALSLYRDVGAWVVVYPPLKEVYRAFCDGDTVMPAADYLVRDDHIARACKVLVACPKNRFEETQSGTWFTVRRARQYGKPVVVVWPDGDVEGG